jgi:hypothetical protein
VQLGNNAGHRQKQTNNDFKHAYNIPTSRSFIINIFINAALHLAAHMYADLTAIDCTQMLWDCCVHCPGFPAASQAVALILQCAADGEESVRKLATQLCGGMWFTSTGLAQGKQSLLLLWKPNDMRSFMFELVLSRLGIGIAGRK